MSTLLMKNTNKGRTTSLINLHALFMTDINSTFVNLTTS